MNYILVHGIEEFSTDYSRGLLREENIVVVLDQGEYSTIRYDVGGELETLDVDESFDEIMEMLERAEEGE